MVAGFIEVHPGGHRDYPVCLGLLGCALVFIWGNWVNLGTSWGSSGAVEVLGFIRGRWVHWDTP